MAASPWFSRLFRHACKVQLEANHRSRWNPPPLRLERLEDPLAPATVTDGGSTTLRIVLDKADDVLAVISNGPTYEFGHNVNTFVNGGVANPADFSAFGATKLRMNASGLARYSTIRVEDTAA